jgi:hypothetical protein
MYKNNPFCFFITRAHKNPEKTYHEKNNEKTEKNTDFTCWEREREKNTQIAEIPVMTRKTVVVRVATKSNDGRKSPRILVLESLLSKMWQQNEIR